jgi:mono/diheme cytochrome c family protein
MPSKTPVHTIRIAALLVLAMTLAGAATMAQTPAGSAGAGTATPSSRGQALYATHCIACHNTQVHWRDAKLAGDWPSLKAQVSRWQAMAALGWSEADVVEVARYLNDSFYRYPQTSDLVGLLAVPR